MGKINCWQDPELTEAILIWTGHGDAASPRRDSSWVELRFSDEGDKWLAIIESLTDDFYDTKANIEAKDISEMWTISIVDFKAKYPDVPDKIAKALAWCYTFDNR